MVVVVGGEFELWRGVGEKVLKVEVEEAMVWRLWRVWYYIVAEA